MDPTRLGECLRVFKNNDPQVYDKFMLLLDAYATDIVLAVTEAPQTDILVAQGRAQMALKFLRIAKELPTQ
jgi:hypothetical protein